MEKEITWSPSSRRRGWFLLPVRGGEPEGEGVFFLFSSLENNTGTVLSVPLCSTLMSVTVWVLLSVMDRGVGRWVGAGVRHIDVSMARGEGKRRCCKGWSGGKICGRV